ncbi:MAG: hypothetical protein AAF267_17875 [Deinococcota bacterium]
MVKGNIWLQANAEQLGINPEHIQPASVDLCLGMPSAPSSGMMIKDGKLILSPGIVHHLPTVESINMPADCAAQMKLKSSKARAGLNMSGGWVDPGFRGNLTAAVTVTYQTELTIGQPFLQLVFYQVDAVDIIYDGKYQDSVGAVGER